MSVIEKNRIEHRIESGTMIQEDPNNIWKVYNKTVTGRRKAEIKNMVLSLMIINKWQMY